MSWLAAGKPMFEEAMRDHRHQQRPPPTDDRLRAMKRQCMYLQGAGGCPCERLRECRIPEIRELMLLAAAATWQEKSDADATN